ncbi:hypothetical protein FOA52_000322 [Chlamydomonas sp. UWO 241]|nr:hypothetical protein FOA52_000322 [Chlamydomonas sp. UWO 241]
MGVPATLDERPKEEAPRYYYAALVDRNKPNAAGMVEHSPNSASILSGSSLMHDSCGNALLLSGDQYFVINDKMDPFEDVQLGAMLGRGAFGRVYRAQWDGTTVAVKVLEHEASSVGCGVLEGVLSMEISHPNVIKTYKHCTREMPCATMKHLSGKQLLETWIVMEFCSLGTLSDAVDRGWFRQMHSLFELDFNRIIGTGREIAAAMAYLHSANILHGDLTGGNILLVPNDRENAKFSAKIADFGFSRVLEGTGTVQTSTYGTVTHTPPELIVDGVLSKSCDVYAFGMLLWEMYMGQRPFTGLNQAQIMHHVMSGRSLKIANSCPDNLRKLIM